MMCHYKATLITLKTSNEIKKLKINVQKGNYRSDAVESNSPVETVVKSSKKPFCPDFLLAVHVQAPGEDLYCTVLHCTALYCSVLHCTAQTTL